MSPTNVEVVRRALDGFSREDRAAVAPLLHPDIEFRTILGPLLGVETVRGRDAVLGFLFEDIPDGFHGLGSVVDELTDLGNGRVLLVARYRGRGKGSGVEVDVRVSSVYTVKGEVVLSVRDYDSREEAVKAVGAG